MPIADSPFFHVFSRPHLSSSSLNVSVYVGVGSSDRLV